MKASKRNTSFMRKCYFNYRYEVLGGLHSVVARQQLSDEDGLAALNVVEAKIFIGLTDGEALHLGSRHNINGHTKHDMTHRDYVSGTCNLQI